MVILQAICFVNIFFVILFSAKDNVQISKLRFVFKDILNQFVVVLNNLEFN